MHLSERAYFFIVATAVLAIAGLWSTDPALVDLWRWPAMLLLAGLACEGFLIHRVVLLSDVETAARPPSAASRAPHSPSATDLRARLGSSSLL